MMIHLIRHLFLVIATFIATLRIIFPQLKDTLFTDLVSLSFQSHKSDLQRVLQVVDSEQFFLWVILLLITYAVANKFLTAKFTLIYLTVVIILNYDWILGGKSHQIDYVSRFPPITVIKDNNAKRSSVNKDNQPDLILIIQEALRADFFTKEYYPKTFSALDGSEYVTSRMIAAGGSTIISIPRIIHGEAHQSELPFECKSSLLNLVCNYGYSGSYVSGYSYDWYSLSNLIQCCDKVLFLDPQSIQSHLANHYEFESLLKNPLGIRGSMIDDQITSSLSIKNFESADLNTAHLSILHLVNTHAPYTGISHPPLKENINLPNAIHTLVMDQREVPKYAQKIKRDYIRALTANDELISNFIYKIKDISKSRKRPVYLIITGDHGEYLGEYGRFFHATGVPLCNIIAEVGFLFARVDQNNDDFSYIDKTLSLLPFKLMRHIDIAPSLRTLGGEKILDYSPQDGCPLFYDCSSTEKFGVTLEQRQKFITNID